MVEPISLSIGVGLLVKSAPSWFPSIRDKVIGTGKDELVKKGQERVQTFLDEKKHQRHIELALQNAAERGIRQWHTSEERDCYNSVLKILSEGGSEALRQEAMQLFTLSDDPDLTILTEKYNLSQRIRALAQHTIHTEVDAVPYLRSFFQSLLAELYNDSLFREQMGDVMRVRAAVQGTRSLEEILQTLENIQGLLTDDYTPQKFQRELEDYLEYIEKKYRFHKFAGIVMRGEEDKAPELDHIFVPLRIALSSNIARSSEESPPTDLVTLLKKHPYLVLLGGPGSGKSTTTCHLAWLYSKVTQQMMSSASASSSGTLAGEPLPLRIELRLFSDARRQNAEYSFLSYAAQVLLGREHITVSSQLFQTLLERRALFVLFDGLDEVATLSERRQLVEEIELFTQRYPGNRILVTSRPVGYELANITDPSFQHAEIQDFDDDQIQQFLESWYHYVLRLPSLSSEEQRELELFRNTLKENPRLHKLAANPLLLTVMTALHRYERLPDERVLIYDKCADLLLDTWARLKHEGARWKEMKLGKEDQMACLAHLGFVLHQRSQELAQEEQEVNELASDTAVDVSARFLRQELRRFLAQQNLLIGAEQHAEVERLLEMVRTEAGLIVSRGTGEDGEPLYGFVHRTFQEYFAALHILNQYLQEDDSQIIRDFLTDYVHDPHWQEVLLLLFGKFKHKFATSQFRFILAGKTRRSRYSNILSQDLFFVANCLADGIVVNQDFAGEVITKLGQIVQETPFQAQLNQAVSVLMLLRRTRQYSAQSKQVFLILYQFSDNLDWLLQVTEAIYRSSPSDSEEEREGGRLLITRYQRGDLPLEQEIQVVTAIYQSSPQGSEEKREGGRLLKELMERGDLTLEQEVQIAAVIYASSPQGSEEEREGGRLLMACYQRGDLTLEQEVQVATAIYQSSPQDSDEQREGWRLLMARYQRGDLTLEQEVQIATAIYQSSPQDSEEEREGWRLLKELMERKDLALEQEIQVVKEIYQSHPFGSEEEREGCKLLMARYQRGNLTLEQEIQIATAIYLYGPFGSEEEREGWRLLKELMERGDLTLEQEIQVVKEIYQSHLVGSEEEQEGGKLLMARYQRGDLTLEQEIQIATAIYQSSPSGSEEEREGWRLLKELMERGDLPLEQEVQVVTAIYRSSPSGSQEQRVAFQLLKQIVQNTHVELDIRLNVALLPCEASDNNFGERMQIIHLLLTFAEEETVRALLAERWQSPPLVESLYGRGITDNQRRMAQYDHFVSDIPTMLALIQQDALPQDARNELYQLLQEMVPLFNQVDPALD